MQHKRLRWGHGRSANELSLSKCASEEGDSRAIISVCLTTNMIEYEEEIVINSQALQWYITSSISPFLYIRILRGITQERCVVMSIGCLEMVIVIFVHIGSITDKYHAKRREGKERRYNLAGTFPVFFFVLQASYGVPFEIHASRLGLNRVRRTRISGFWDPFPLNERVGLGNDRSRAAQRQLFSGIGEGVSE